MVVAVCVRAYTSRLLLHIDCYYIFIYTFKQSSFAAFKVKKFKGRSVKKNNGTLSRLRAKSYD